MEKHVDQNGVAPASAKREKKAEKTIQVVDDTKENLTVIGELLEPHYRVRLALSGERALKVAQLDPRPDLILLDVMMPEMDGYAVLERLRAIPAMHDIPVIFVTAMNAMEDEEKGLRLGAVDYVTKPIRPAILLARVNTHVELKQARDWLQDQNGYLESEVRRRMWENDLIKDVSLNALAMLAEKRDNETGNHLHRTQHYVEALMLQLSDHPRFRDHLNPRQRTLIGKAVPLHDIGKVGVPDQILLKPARLTPDEFEIIKTHAQIGADAIEDAIQRVLGNDSELLKSEREDSPLAFLEMARKVALYHHEKWDGTGYPHGLAGDDIPVCGRLMAVADVFDAVISRRHYKEAMPIDEVVKIISEGRGKHFDPDIVDAFMGLQDLFVEISRRYADVKVAA
jgi:putative two-component system response regulator